MAVSSLGPLKEFMTWRKSWSRQNQRSRSAASTCSVKSQCDIVSSNTLCYYFTLHYRNPVVLQHMPSYVEEHVHDSYVQMQELRTQLHKDSQEQQELLDQQHDVIVQLEQQKQSLQVIVAMQSVGLMCASVQNE